MVVVVAVELSVVVVVVGGWLDVDVLVSGGEGGGAADVGSSVTGLSDGDCTDEAGVVLTLGDGVDGAVPEVWRSVIITPAPMASTASAVPTATTNGRRYHGSGLAS